MAPKTLLTSSSLLIILSLQYFFQSSHANCTPSACGIIQNISYPFRLKDDPSHCGDDKFELACENNVTSTYFNSHEYLVKEINYHNKTIRLVDASLNNHPCSFPNSSAYHNNFTDHDPYPYPYHYHPPNYPYRIWNNDDVPIHLMSCPHPLENSSLFIEITRCASISSNVRYSYVKVDRMAASDVPETCRVDLIVMTSWKFADLNNVSIAEIHRSLLFGFELNYCIDCVTYYNTEFAILPILLASTGLLLCAWISLPVMIIFGFIAVLGLLYITTFLFMAILNPSDFPHVPLLVIDIFIDFIILAPRFIVFPLALWLLIYKFRRRHLSVYNTIESFLQTDNQLAPIRYSYSDIKKMTRGFCDKLGEGGYSSVYKGKLRSGHAVAVKVLEKFGADGQDFINEIATIGRIHHVNIVKLVGYCAQGSKRALVFDFMPNGSLEKYLFNREKMNFLNWDTKFEIAVGVARGIEYLHQGCDIRILHFDIKPHNILLDDKFVPKISDFGLAKFCSTDKNTITMTNARGTIGYVAPELINRSIGAISYKADVYSFGMLLMEMASLKRHLIENNCDSSKYFPYWIYDCFNQGKDIEIENTDENNDNVENDIARKLARKITIVALWCTQMSPDDRPPMNKVLEMLESDVERLQIPNYPSQMSVQIEVNVDQAETTCSTDSLSLLHHDVLSCVDITVQP